MAIIILSTIGSIFIFLAALGIVRMPDFYLRLSVTIKAGTFGIGFLLLSAALYFNEFSVTTKVMAILFFLIITAPVSGHMIGKTAYKMGIKLWDKSIHDDLKEYIKNNPDYGRDDDEDDDQITRHKDKSKPRS